LRHLAFALALRLSLPLPVNRELPRSLGVARRKIG
jgi:hypothetical protein